MRRAFESSSSLAGLVLMLLALVGGCGGTSASPSGQAGAAGTDQECAADADCDDGLLCNGIELCDPGSSRADSAGCVAGAAVDCEDGIACTEDRCVERTGECLHLAPDLDGDSFGDAACEDASGNPVGTDCDDSNADRFPGNVEVCEFGKASASQDEDCDPATLGGIDEDDDGYEDSRCCNPDGSDLVCGRDCDDSNSLTFPGATELCDLEDNDCNEVVDDSVVNINWYRDDDEDLYGDPNSVPIETCENLTAQGYTDNSRDCDDGDKARNPGREEVCDGKDNDCDGEVDQGLYCGECQCDLNNATAECPRGQFDCQVASCDALWLDCDEGQPSGALNGCESNGTTEATCGTCDNSCGAFERCAGEGTLENYSCKCAPGAFRDGDVCKECPAGQYCPGEEIPPKDCELGHWDHDSNPATACLAWSTCSAGQRILTEGTETSDRVCTPCVDGYTEIDNASSCISWIDCEPGQKVTVEPTTTNQRVCEACPEGTVTDSKNAPGCSMAFSDISCGSNVACAIESTTGLVRCWATTEPHFVNAAAISEAPTEPVTSIAFARGSSSSYQDGVCALAQDDGAPICWGLTGLALDDDDYTELWSSQTGVCGISSEQRLKCSTIESGGSLLQETVGIDLSGYSIFGGFYGDHDAIVGQLPGGGLDFFNTRGALITATLSGEAYSTMFSHSGRPQTLCGVKASDGSLECASTGESSVFVVPEGDYITGRVNFASHVLAARKDGTLVSFLPNSPPQAPTVYATVAYPAASQIVKSCATGSAWCLLHEPGGEVRCFDGVLEDSPYQPPLL